MLRIRSGIDELSLDYPFTASRMLREEGLETGRLHVAMLIRKTGIDAISRRSYEPAYQVFIDDILGLL